LPAPALQRLERWPGLLAVLLLAAAVRLWRLDGLSFWTDEAATVHFARGTPFDIWGTDTHPPLYYALIALWRHLGESEYALRLSSVLFSLGSVWAIFRCGAEIGGRFAAPLAGALLALSPFAVYHAQELRMYALLECVVAWSLLGLLRLLRRPQAVAATPLLQAPLRAAWLLYASGSLLALYTHNLGALWPLCASLGVLWLWGRRPERRRLLGRWVLVNAAVLALWLPYWPVLLSQAGGIMEGFWIRQPAPAEALGLLGHVTLGLGPRFDALELGLAAAFLGAAAVGLAVLWRSGLGSVLLILALVPPLLCYGLELVARPLFAPRAFIWVDLPAVLAIACGLSALVAGPRPALSASLRVAAIGCVVLLLCVRAVAVANAYGRAIKSDWRGFVAELAWEMHPSDKVAVMPGYELRSYQHYRGRQALDGRPTPPVGTERLWAYDGLLALAQALPPGERLWFLRSERFTGPDPLPRLQDDVPCLTVAGRLHALYLDAALLLRDPTCAAEP